MEHQVLINALKKALKLKGVTYPKLAKMLEISEGSVGRIFSEGTFTLNRFVKICNLIGLSIEDLILLEEIEVPGRQFEYTLEQEQYLARPLNKNILVFFELLIHGKTPQEIAREYGLDDNMLVKILSQLEKLGLIEWLPENQAKILTSKMITFLKDGPISKTYTRETLEDFFKHDFNGKNEVYIGSFIQLSLKHQERIVAKMEALLKEIKKEIKIEDMFDTKTEAVGMVLAIRSWKPEYFYKFDKSQL